MVYGKHTCQRATLPFTTLFLNCGVVAQNRFYCVLQVQPEQADSWRDQPRKAGMFLILCSTVQNFYTEFSRVLHNLHITSSQSHRVTPLSTSLIQGSVPLVAIAFSAATFSDTLHSLTWGGCSCSDDAFMLLCVKYIVFFVQMKIVFKWHNITDKVCNLTSVIILP